MAISGRHFQFVQGAATDAIGFHHFIDTRYESLKKNPGPASGIFRQHRTIQREHSARDFLSRRDLESAGV
ncbi:hypothetical protein, partial [Faecousia sp.]|uniref:hypothetical protein n=1 Tax=Faecousia sp. TaxID=2952921 RepID=UPI002A9E4287|nr:hypothetical protein [Candidatus Faecousia sp.]